MSTKNCFVWITIGLTLISFAFAAHASHADVVGMWFGGASIATGMAALVASFATMAAIADEAE